jgi:septal ring factor EnvC (AmiA/AmiB activator)
MSDLLKGTGDLLAAAAALADGKLLKQLQQLHDQIIADQKNLAGLSEQGRTLAKEKRQLETDRAAHIAKQAADQAALDKRSAELERKERLHSESAHTLAAEQSKWSAEIAAYKTFKTAVGQ